jgi:sugar/nucleoside kinase (ribokinase family)
VTPDLLILGQITIDHVVPALPSCWYEALGGNALYAAAGARLWLDPTRIGIVARRGPNAPAKLVDVLSHAGIATSGLTAVPDENLVEWMIYETDGSRRNLPRSPELRDLRYDAAARSQRYLASKAAVSATADDIPAAWLSSARAIHIAPQVLDRHPRSIAALAHPTRLLSVDPSPTYSATLSVGELCERLRGAGIFLPSQAEVGQLVTEDDWGGLAERLAANGFPEVVVKLGERGAVVVPGQDGAAQAIPAAAAEPVDFTGAGDAFCGAYLANRLIGHSPAEAARRAVVAAAMVVECSGVEAALALDPAEARRRYGGYHAAHPDNR